MQLSNKHTVQAPSEKVWKMLMDTASLSKIIPGVSSLEKIDENTFKSSLTIKLGPVSDTFTGSLQLQNINPEKSFTLNIQQNSKIGNGKGEIEIGLSKPDENITVISFDGDIKLSGMIVVFGNRVLRSVSDVLTKQFFANLENELKQNGGAS